MQQPNPLSPWQMWSLEVQNKLKEQQEQLDALERKGRSLCVNRSSSSKHVLLTISRALNIILIN